MLYAYLSAAIVGVVLLVASLLGAGHGHDAGHDGGHGGDGEDVSFAVALQSVRFWTYLLAFGGLTGVLLRLVTRVAEPTAGLGAAGVGVVAGAMAWWVVSRSTRAGASGTVRPGDLVGRSARVLVPMAAGMTGKVRARVAGGDVDVLATSDGDEALERSEEVLIVEVRPGGTALVTRNPISK